MGCDILMPVACVLKAEHSFNQDEVVGKKEQISNHDNSEEEEEILR